MPKERIFVAKKHVGDIPAGHPFTEADFKLLHPLPPDPLSVRIDPATYHAGLINRLLTLGAIEEAPAETEPQPIPDGPVAIAQEQLRLQEEAAAKQAAQAAPPAAVAKK